MGIIINKELGYETDMNNNKNIDNSISNYIKINDKLFKIPTLLEQDKAVNFSNFEIKEALSFNKKLLMENFIIPNHLRFPISRNILEKYYN